MDGVKLFLRKGINLTVTIKQYLVASLPASTASRTVDEDFTDIIEKVKNRIRRQKNSKSKDDAYEPRYKYLGTSRKHNYIRITEQDQELYKANAIYKSGQIRKYCMLLSYSGANYIGCQRLRNNNPFTIEERLLGALLTQNWITPLEHRHSSGIEFMRASRTDKGVSAMRQCVSLLLVRNLNYDLDALNRELPYDIRVFGIKRVTPKFDPRTTANGRSYSYTMPTVALANCTDPTSMRDFRIAADKLQYVNNLLDIYKGTKNYHNFTTRVEHYERSAMRHMTRLKCSEPFIRNDVEFITIEITGDSFMYHQIRKMMGALIAVIRGLTDPSLFNRAFSQGTMDIPTAPGTGLVLDKVHYDRYNKSIGKMAGNHEKLLWDEFDSSVNDFREDFILPQIIRSTIETDQMAQYLESLEKFTYMIIPESDIDTKRKDLHRRPFTEQYIGKNKERV